MVKHIFYQLHYLSVSFCFWVYLLFKHWDCNIVSSQKQISQYKRLIHNWSEEKGNFLDWIHFKIQLTTGPILRTHSMKFQTCKIWVYIQFESCKLSYPKIVYQEFNFCSRQLEASKIEKKCWFHPDTWSFG